VLPDRHQGASARADSLPTWGRFGGMTGTRTALAAAVVPGTDARPIQACWRCLDECALLGPGALCPRRAAPTASGTASTCLK
jgi:hypothetical protein